MTVDWTIEGGRVIDPATGRDEVADVAVKDGVIVGLWSRDGGGERDERIPDDSRRRYDATGCIVTPGLVDVHGHVYEHATPLGVDADTHCLRRGTTTVVDAGSAGFSTFPGLRHFIAERAQCRVLAFLNISSIGLAGSGLGGDASIPGDLQSLKYAAVDEAAAFVAANRDLIVGIKIRLSASVADAGRYEWEGYRRARILARQVGLPLMVHHSVSTVPLAAAPGWLQPGDIYTHVFHGFQNTIIDLATGQIHPAVKAARDAGVLFDVGSGQGSFNWTVAEYAAAQGFMPHTISTDLHTGTKEGPTYDLPTVMTRMLHVGMPLQAVVDATTWAPARAIGWHDRIGSLQVGREADITVLSLDDVDVDLEDCQSQRRRVTKRLTPRAVWRSGHYVQCEPAAPWPNPVTIRQQKASWHRLVVRDEKPPF